MAILEESYMASADACNVGFTSVNELWPMCLCFLVCFFSVAKNFFFQ